MTILTRQEAALYLRSKGLRSSKITLAKLAMTGEGPQYALAGVLRIIGLNGWMNGLIIN